MSILRYLLINEKQDENLPVASSYACCMLSVDRNDLALKYMTCINNSAFYFQVSDFSLKLDTTQKYVVHSTIYLL